MMYPANLHMHTVASTHAYSTLHNYITKMKRKGIKFFVITGHGPDMADILHYWHSVNIHIWPRLVDGVGILYGIESSIKNIEGEIDCSGSMLASLDLIITGFHESVFPSQDRDIHTQAVIAAMVSDKVYMISHSGNPKFPVGIPTIAEVAARYQVALEINSSSFTSSRVGNKDNRRAITAAVHNAGRWMALGSDSHTALTLGEPTECRKILDTIDFPEERILNVSPCRLLNLLESRDMPTTPEFVDL